MTPDRFKTGYDQRTRAFPSRDQRQPQSLTASDFLDQIQESVSIGLWRPYEVTRDNIIVPQIVPMDDDLARAFVTGSLPKVIICSDQPFDVGRNVLVQMGILRTYEQEYTTTAHGEPSANPVVGIQLDSGHRVEIVVRKEGNEITPKEMHTLTLSYSESRTKREVWGKKKGGEEGVLLLVLHEGRIESMRVIDEPEGWEGNFDGNGRLQEDIPEESAGLERVTKIRESLIKCMQQVLLEVGMPEQPTPEKILVANVVKDEFVGLGFEPTILVYEVFDTPENQQPRVVTWRDSSSTQGMVITAEVYGTRDRFYDNTALSLRIHPNSDQAIVEGYVTSVSNKKRDFEEDEEPVWGNHENGKDQCALVFVTYKGEILSIRQATLEEGWQDAIVGFRMGPRENSEREKVVWRGPSDEELARRYAETSYTLDEGRTSSSGQVREASGYPGQQVQTTRHPLARPVSDQQPTLPQPSYRPSQLSGEIEQFYQRSPVYRDWSHEDQMEAERRAREIKATNRKLNRGRRVDTGYTPGAVAPQRTGEPRPKSRFERKLRQAGKAKHRKNK